MARVYRLDVVYPSGSEVWGWAPEGWDDDHPGNQEMEPDTGAWGPAPFSWPVVRRYLSRSGAEKRADLLRRYGAVVTVVASDPVTWPDGRGDAVMMSRPRTRWSTTVGDTRRSHQSEPAVYRWISSQAAAWHDADPATRHEQQFIVVWFDERLGRGWQRAETADLATWALASWSDIS